MLVLKLVRSFSLKELASSELDTRLDELVEKLNELNDRRNSLNEESPQIPRGAFERAKRGVAVGEASYAADK